MSGDAVGGNRSTDLVATCNRPQVGLKEERFMREHRRGFFKGMWRGIDATRRFVINVVFLILVVAVIVVLLKDDKPKIPKRTVLVINPQGPIVEQLGGDPMERAMAKLMGQDEPETLLKDLVDAIDAAAEDERVEVLLLDLNQMGGGWLTKLQDLGRAIDDFKAAGKTVVAASDFYDKNRYYLAAHADEIWIHQMGIVVLEGYGRYRTYYKDMIDRLEIDPNVIRVGTFKSAVEPFLRDDMSDAAKEANMMWMGDLWRIWMEDVAAARSIPIETLQDFVDNFNDHLAAANGEMSEAALAIGLVDHTATRDEVRDRLIELVGEDEESHSFHRIGYASYLESLDEDRFGDKVDGDTIGVVVAKGTIIDGDQPPGIIGGDSTARLIRKARHNDDIKAIVLRVDSGGGSAFASEVIRRELELAREDGKPVVISMGSVAASGGYWISMSSDEVWAYPSTITGSIGIFGMFPTFQKPMAKYLGMRVDGVGTAPLAGALRQDRALDPGLRDALQMMIEQGYREFIGKVAKARGTTPEEIDAIAQGRVWSGEDAHELGLVDNLGDFDDAVAAAAKLAELGEDYGVTYIQKELDFKEKLLIDLLEATVRITGPVGPGSTMPPLVDDTTRYLRQQAEALAMFNDPNGVYAACFCEID